jgi:hypothetical protein
MHGKIYYLKDTYHDDKHGLRKTLAYVHLRTNDNELFSSALRSDATPFFFQKVTDKPGWHNIFACTK